MLIAVELPGIMSDLAGASGSCYYRKQHLTLNEPKVE